MIDPARRRRVEQLCDAALDRDEHERVAFVANACGDDQALRRDVEALLAHAQMAEGFLSTSIGAVAVQVLGADHAVSLVGQHLGPYRIHSHIGAGGMGEVYRARDTRLGRDVALKLLPIDVSLQHDRSRNFRREAQAIASLNHPHICILHDVGQQGGFNYLVMEYLEGPTLKQRLLEHSPLPLNETLRIASQIADALLEAHRHGIVHRDVKPGNIKLTKTGAKLLDFGLAHTLEPFDSQVFDSNIIAGTPWYMSPEQVLGKNVDPRSDVFSLGVVIYEMIAGRRPFDGETAIEVTDAVLHKHPIAVTVLDSGVSPALARLVAKCLEKDRDDRYQSIAEVWTDLAAIGPGETSQAWNQPGAIRRHNLPIQLTSFIGRDREIADARTMLSHTRLLTLSGSGGCGKTRLALKIASTLTDNYEDGVWLIELAPIPRSELIPHQVASVFGVGEEHGLPLEQRLLEYLKARRLLLVLDNCEHLVAGVAAFAESILKACGGVQILATTREPLRIAGERLWRVPSLSCPDSTSVPPGELAEYEAVRLFIERAASVSPFRLERENAEHVNEICRRLDGIPLALEMAAARLDVLSPDQIAARLANRFRLLAGPQRKPLARHETLRSTIDWSYDLLSSREQTLFGRLAVFRGSFSLEAVEKICAGDDLHSSDILEILSRLVDKSMVSVQRTAVGLRYRLLETLREYASEKAAAPSDAIRDKHADYFLNLAAQLEPEYYSKQTGPFFERVEEDHQNFLAALEWCSTASGRSAEGLQLSASLLPFWDVRCYHQLAKDLLLQALDRDGQRAPKPIREKALDAAGYFLAITGELSEARLKHEESLRLSKELGDQHGVGKALWRLGIIALREGRSDAAEMLQREGLEINRKGGFKINLAGCLNNLGILAFDRGEYHAAESYWQESRDVFSELGFELGLTISLINHARLAADRGDHGRANALFTDALARARQMGHKGNIAFAMISLGETRLESSYDQSRAFIEEALAIVRAVGYTRYIAIALGRLATLALREGDDERARQMLDESLVLLRQIDEEESPNGRDCRLRMAEVAFEQAFFADALEECEQLAARETLHSRRQVTLALFGWVRLATRDHTGAYAAFREILTLAQKSGSSVASADAELGLGYLDLLSGSVSEPRFNAALSLYEGRNNRTGMVNALLALADVMLLTSQPERSMTFALQANELARNLRFSKGIARAIRTIGIVASRQGQPELAARCFGSSAVLLGKTTDSLPWFQLIGYEAALTSTRSELGFDRFQRLYGDGGLTQVDIFADLFGEQLQMWTPRRFSKHAGQ